MYCEKCGKKIAPGYKFCQECGTPVVQPKEEQVNVQQKQVNVQQPASNNTNDVLAKVLAGFMVAVFGFLTLRYGFFTIRSVFYYIRSFFYYFSFVNFIYNVIDIFLGLIRTFGCLIFAVVGASFFKSTKESRQSSVILPAIAGIVLILVQIITMFMVMVVYGGYYYGFFYVFKEYSWLILISIIFVALSIVLVLVLDGSKLDLSNPGALISASFKSVTNDLKGTAASVKTASQNVASHQNNPKPQNNNVVNNPVNTTAPIIQGGAFVKEDRNLMAYVIFTLLTCGIYSYFFLYSMIKDVNTVCNGDGESTPGLFKFIIFGMLSCGLYSYYWYYKLGNRLFFNARRYGLEFEENGSNILTWMILGSFLLGSGVWIALYIVFHNTNVLCKAYNRALQGNA